MKIFNKSIGINEPTYFIAEIGSNFDGSLDRAKTLIKIAADHGADAVKFQHYTAETLVSDVGFQNLDSSVETHQSKWKESVSVTYDRASLNREWTEELCEEAHKYNVGFFTSPYSEYLVDFVEQNVDAYKIGSGDITYTKIIDQISKKGKPVLIATGAANIDPNKETVQQKAFKEIGINDRYCCKRHVISHIDLVTKIGTSDDYWELKEMLEDVTSMELMLDEFLEFSKSKLNEKTQKTNIYEFVESIVKKNKKHFKNLVLEISKSLEKSFSMSIRTNGLKRAIQNIIDNSITYGKNISFKINKEKNNLIFEIEDDGIGIEEKDYEIAFHPFTRLDKSRNQNNHSGVGLGLSIANDVIRMHGGQLSLYKSTALGGLGVRIRLPI